MIGRKNLFDRLFLISRVNYLSLFRPSFPSFFTPRLSKIDAILKCRWWARWKCKTWIWNDKKMEKVFFHNIFPAEIFFLASNLLKRRARLNNFQIVLSIKVEFFVKTWLNYYQNERKIDITIFVIHFSPILNFPISNYQPLSTHYTSREFLIFFLHGSALNRPYR